MRTAPGRPARIVLDANILVSAAIAAGRTPGSTLGRAVDRALAGDTTVITCPRLLAEVERVLRRPRLARWVDPEEVHGVMRWIVGGSTLVADPEAIVPVCRDPADDYLVALARREAAPIVTGDGDLQALRSRGVDVITVGDLAARLRGEA
jgi:putative PIN family toxin of toxin-antitoxin system